MYTIIIVLLLGVGIALIGLGTQTHRKLSTIIGVLILLGTAIGFLWFFEFWGEMLWFKALGYQHRFWKVVLTKLGLSLAGFIGCGVLVYVLAFHIQPERHYLRYTASVIGALFGGLWGLIHWETFLHYINRVSTAVTDPILHKETGFYLFALPFYSALYSLFLWLALLALIAIAISIFLKITLKDGELDVKKTEQVVGNSQKRVPSLYFNVAILLFVLAWGNYLKRFHLLYSTLGAVTGPGWTDDHIRLPAYLIVSLLTAMLGLIVLILSFRKGRQRLLSLFNISSEKIYVGFLSTIAIILVGMWFLGLNVIPGLFQWLRVEPNEITFEEPYIEWNIKFTQQGFNLHNIEEKEFPVSDEFTRQLVENNQNLFDNIRLWDWRALDAVYKQFQEIRLYYEFEDVDIDRYTLEDEYRQVMVSARELELANLPQQSQTFVNWRFKYTHGYGITLTDVSEFTSEGLPHLLIKDIPPKHEYAALKVERPQIYYGELTDSHVIVNTDEEEFDYPSGEENVYIQYPGQGGVQISNLWRKFLYGWLFDGTRLLLSGYPNAESRIMFHRQIRERVQMLAPFLKFDDDPYIVLVDGKLYWILDAYTTSRYYPYSEPFSAQAEGRYTETLRTVTSPGELTRKFDGDNYIRNAVKVVIDAFEGSVDFYIFEADDPVIRVWQNIFPNMFKAQDEMPESLLAHIRYPANMLLAQGLVYAKYHMTNPTVFYNQEDLWIRATEKYYNQVQPVEPYYIMWELPGSDQPQFVLILPFTPKKRQVMIGWIAGMCDPENYGRLLAYKFPKEKRVLGTQQVETKIDQDSYLSGQLTLWDQRGSNVIRGNVLAIPIENTILYVEPIYLQAETAAYPELRLVAVMHNDNLSYAETFDKAIEGLFQDIQPDLAGPEAPSVAGQSVQELISQANTAFENYLNALGEQRFDDAAQALNTLQQSLQQLSTQTQTEE